VISEVVVYVTVLTLFKVRIVQRCLDLQVDLLSTNGCGLSHWAKRSNNRGNLKIVRSGFLVGNRWERRTPT
jgi:hypothetical protein